MSWLSVNFAQFRASTVMPTAPQHAYQRWHA
jgi:hypothetical protein